MLLSRQYFTRTAHSIFDIKTLCTRLSLRMLQNTRKDALEYADMIYRIHSFLRLPSQSTSTDNLRVGWSLEGLASNQWLRYVTNGHGELPAHRKISSLERRFQPVRTVAMDLLWHHHSPNELLFHTDPSASKNPPYSLGPFLIQAQFYTETFKWGNISFYGLPMPELQLFAGGQVSFRRQPRKS